MTGSLIAGWSLFGIGALMYLGMLVKKALSLRNSRSSSQQESLRQIKNTVEALTLLAEALSKFSEDMQYLILATGCLIGGIDMLQNQPFQVRFGRESGARLPLILSTRQAAF